MNDYCMEILGHGVIIEASNESQPDSFQVISQRAQYNVEESKAGALGQKRWLLDIVEQNRSVQDDALARGKKGQDQRKERLLIKQRPQSPKTPKQSLSKQLIPSRIHKQKLIQCENKNERECSVEGNDSVQNVKQHISEIKVDLLDQFEEAKQGVIVQDVQIVEEAKQDAAAFCSIDCIRKFYPISTGVTPEMMEEFKQIL